MQDKNKISKEDVEHVAKLARIAISNEEKELYSKQLSSILEYVDRLNEVDTSKVEKEKNNNIGLKNIFREDLALKCLDQEELVEAAPSNEQQMVKVKAILKGGKQ